MPSPEPAAPRVLLGLRENWAQFLLLVIINAFVGGMLAFELAGGELAVGPFLDVLALPTIAVSLGDAGSLIWPIGGGVLRLSVGLEDQADLEADFRDALAALPRTRADTGS